MNCLKINDLKSGTNPPLGSYHFELREVSDSLRVKKKAAWDTAEFGSEEADPGFNSRGVLFRVLVQCWAPRRLINFDGQGLLSEKRLESPAIFNTANSSPNWSWMSSSLAAEINYNQRHCLGQCTINQD
jgi:hypothetical protein